jgi:hypothetical protein
MQFFANVCIPYTHYTDFSNIARFCIAEWETLARYCENTSIAPYGYRNILEESQTFFAVTLIGCNPSPCQLECMV